MLRIETISTVRFAKQDLMLYQKAIIN